ncbi:MAG TPA: 4-hydroxy-tetrahydrodipicolinate synthase [Clostridia bacterium]|jgi:4-hydroxy-tetrahydrodipicolinate synthase|nr:4-hydroxy-tetrahydrodipicolinate synthase [Clostridia bacterium]
MNHKTDIKGIVAPILTPMLTDESIHFEELRRQTDRLIAAGCHALFCFGTNGEGYALSGMEKKQVLECVIEQADHRVPVYAGTGCITTRETIAQSLMAEAAGADVLSLVTPSFAQASQSELYEHYKAVAEAVHLPIVLYNIPARTGNALAPETVEKLSQIDNIIGVKDSSGSFENILAYLEAGKSRKTGDFATLSGNDSLILKTLQAGGSGAVAGCANVYPRTMVSIYEHFVSGDLIAAETAQESIASFRACFKYGNPNTIVKTSVRLLGYDVGFCRRPFNQLSDEGIAALNAVLTENEAKGMR